METLQQPQTTISKWMESEKIGANDSVLLFGKMVDADVLALRKDDINVFGYNLDGKYNLEDAKEFIINPDPEDFYTWIVCNDLSLSLLDAEALADTLKKFNFLGTVGIFLVVPIADRDGFISLPLRTSSASWKSKLSLEEWDDVIGSNCTSAKYFNWRPVTDREGIMSITIRR